SMRYPLVITAALFAVAFRCDCQPSKPKVAALPVSKPAVAPSSAKFDPAVTPANSDAKTAESAVKPNETAKDEEKQPTADADGGNSAAKSAKDDPKKDSQEGTASSPPAKPHPERIAILTSGGPLIADVTLSIDGHPANEAFEKLVDGVLAAATSD